MIRTVFMLLVVLVITAIVNIGMLLTAPFDRRHRMFNFWYYLWSVAWLWSAGVRLRIEGAEHVPGPDEPPVLLAGNHQSALDIPVLTRVTRGRMRFMAKSSLRFVPVAGQLMWMFGFTFVNRKHPRRSRAALQAMVKRVREGLNSLCIFPEGTRSPSGLLKPFKRGTFKLIKQTDAPLVPFAILGTGDVLPRGSWWVRPGEVEVHIGRPIPADEVKRLGRDELLRRTRAFVLQFVPEQLPAAVSGQPSPGVAGRPEVRMEQPAPTDSAVPSAGENGA